MKKKQQNNINVKKEGSKLIRKSAPRDVDQKFPEVKTLKSRPSI